MAEMASMPVASHQLLFLLLSSFDVETHSPVQYGDVLSSRWFITCFG
jgi:hypothetical protein